VSLVARLPSSKPAAATTPTPEHTLAMATSALMPTPQPGHNGRVALTTSSALGPVDRMKISSVLRIAVSAAAGRI
jgi:hypothetical protein